MGIGNQERVQGLPPQPRHWCSLPLMGIGNWQVEAALPLVYVFIDNSLPLMGIGNVVPWDSTKEFRAAPWFQLITPHGDRELIQVDDSRYPAALGRPHYPSWGSGTCTVAIEPSAGPDELITPHGGSGTWRGTLRRCFAGSVGISLPLMGIGNACFRPVDATSTTHCSLPLMGIGNSESSATSKGLVIDILVLITPHGDRELSSDHGIRPFLRVPRPHYPSWGSGTQPRARSRQARQFRSHYPSWGSGTARACPSSLDASVTLISLPLMGIGNPEQPFLRLDRVRRLLITPHGDREPRGKPSRVL